MLFFEAFDQLTVSQDIQDLFGHVEVQKMVASKAKRRLSIHIESDRLITFTNIKKMEYQLKKQVFAGVITDQELAMIPLSELPASRSKSETFETSQQNL